MSDDVVVDFSRFAGGPSGGQMLPRDWGAGGDVPLSPADARRLDELYAGMTFSGFDVVCGTCPGTTHPGCCRQQEIRETASRLRRRLDQLLGRNAK